MTINQHALVVRFGSSDRGLLQPCCFCRPRSVLDLIGEPIADWGLWSPDDLARIYSDHRRQSAAAPHAPLAQGRRGGRTTD